MKRTLLVIFMVALMAGCAQPPKQYKVGELYEGAKYRLIAMSYSGEKDALGAAVLDLEGDDMTYRPHPSLKHVRTFEGLSFSEATEQARELLKWHCGFFTLTTTLLADEQNIHTGYEIRPVIKETNFCLIDRQVSVIYQGPVNDIIVINLPKREALPFEGDVRVLSE